VVDGASARQLREAGGIGLREMARRLGVQASYLSAAETGGRHFTLGLWKRYERELRG